MSEESNQGQAAVTRRQMLGGLAAGAMVMAAASMTACAPTTPTNQGLSSTGSAGLPETWDKEADVVCIGSGAGGSTAAWFALDGGLSAIVVESQALPGGASLANTGELFLGGGTPIQKQFGYNDTPENFKGFLKANGLTGCKNELVDLYVNSGPAIIQWLLDLGVPFGEKSTELDVYKTDNPGSEIEFGLYPTGTEFHPLYRDSWTPSPLCHWAHNDPNAEAEGYEIGGPLYATLNKNIGHGGTGYMLPIIRDVKAKGGEYLLNTLATKIYKDETGTVVGIQAEGPDGTINIHANKGVVVAGGCWIGDPGLAAQFAPEWIDNENLAFQPMTVPGADGSALRLALAVGGVVVNGNSVWQSANLSALGPVLTNCDAYPGIYGIIVNERGVRYFNEDQYYSFFAQRIADTYRKNGLGKAWYIIDDSMLDSINEFLDVWDLGAYKSEDPLYSADSAEELAEMLNAPALAETIEFYNKSAADGIDYACGKFPSHMRPLTPPFHACQLKGFSIYPHGGLDIDVNGAVLDVDGFPIEGLYAAGRCARSTSEGLTEAGTGQSCVQGLVVGRAIGSYLAGTPVDNPAIEV